MQLEQYGTAAEKMPKLKEVAYIPRTISFLLLAMIVSLCGCQHAQMRMPAGKYSSTTGKDYVIVKPSTMFFHLRVVNKPNVFIDREYEYNLWEDGEIFPYGIASGEYYLGVGKYDLRWDGKDIIVKEADNIIILKKASENVSETGSVK